jgi:hypothetical protein
MARHANAISIATLAAAVGMLAVLAACGVGNGGRATSGVDDAGSSNDGSVADGGGGGDGTVVDAGTSCPTVTCNGACVASCAGCDAGIAPCPSTRACGSCGTCVGFELECFTCDDDGGGAPSAFCSALFDKCSAGAGSSHCSCVVGDPMSCPGSQMVCTLDGQCKSCGEDGTENNSCANGLICVFDPKPGCTGS